MSPLRQFFILKYSRGFYDFNQKIAKQNRKEGIRFTVEGVILCPLIKRSRLSFQSVNNNPFFFSL